MPVNEIEIGAEQVALLLAGREGHFSDFKSVKIKPARLTKNISAFANADGGELYVGIDETKAGLVWNGFEDSEAANGHLQIFDELFPLGQFFAYEFLSSEREAGLVLKASILKTPDIKEASDGVIYVRRGAQSLPYRDRDAIAQLERAKGVTTHETATLAVPPDVISNSETIIGFMLQVVPTGEPEPWLRKQQLLIGDRPTVAGVVLFADEPQVAVPKAAVKIYRYKTKDDEGTRETLASDPETIEGCLYDQIYGSVSRVKEIVQEIPVLGTSGMQEVSYPDSTLHEIIANAILHRDYAMNDDVHVRIFDNRIEVESPGNLPAHITAENILDERFARNPSIVRLINKFPDPPNKDVGEGLNTAFAAMKALRLQAPSIESTSAGVLVKIRHETLASPEEQILEYLDSHPHIANMQAREITNIGSENKVKRIFQKMMEAGLIEKLPDRSQAQTAYRRVVKHTSHENQTLFDE